MIRYRVDVNTIQIKNPNFMRDIDGSIKEEVREMFLGKIINSFKVIDVEILNRGMCISTLAKGVEAEVDVKLKMQTLVIPPGVLLPECKFQSSVKIGESTRYAFTLKNDKLADELTSLVHLAVSSNGISAESIKLLDNLAKGDIIPLFVISSMANHIKGTLQGYAVPNFDGKYSTLFKFTESQVTSGKFDEFCETKLNHEKVYEIKKQKLVESSKPPPYVDFLDDDQLFEYLKQIIYL